MKRIALFALLTFSLLTACGDDEKLVVCTKEECCCPDSLEIDQFNQFGYDPWKPKVLKGDAKWDAINIINAAELEGFRKEEPEYVIRAWYPGGGVPRVFRIQGSFVKENTQDWYDTGIDDFGKKLYEGLPLK